MSLEELLIEIQNRNTEASAAVVNAVTALQRQLAEQTRQIQRASEWHPEDTGGVSGGTFTLGSTAQAPDWLSKGRVGGDHIPSYKALTMYMSRGLWYADMGATIPMGAVAKIKYAVENQYQQEVLVSLPAGGLLSVPVCSGEATVEFLLEQIAFTAPQMQSYDGTAPGAISSGLGWPNYPVSRKINLGAAGSAAALPVISLGMSADQAIPRSTPTLPSRKVTVYAASGDGAFPLYIPKGTQAFILQGPSDATFNQQDQTGNFPAQRIDAPIAPNVITQLMPGVQFIECASAGGGSFSATFFLGT